MKSLLSGSLMLNKVNLMSLSVVTDYTLLHRDVMGCISQSVYLKLLLDSSSRTEAGRSPPPLPPTSPPKTDPGAVFTLLITGEGPADRRAITDSPQARGWERYKRPPLSPKCDGNVQLSRGSLHWQNPRAQREILKT